MCDDVWTHVRECRHVTAHMGICIWMCGHMFQCGYVEVCVNVCVGCGHMGQLWTREGGCDMCEGIWTCEGVEAREIAQRYGQPIQDV